ncbi:MAG: hypothetical protein AB1700_06330, partial [Bacillota bacterium]
VSVEAIVLETVVLNVVTGVESPRVEAGEASIAPDNAQATSRHQAAGPRFLPRFLHLLYAFTSRLKGRGAAHEPPGGPGPRPT